MPYWLHSVADLVSFALLLGRSDTNIPADTLKQIVMRSLEEFGDKFSIKHLSIIVQNGESTFVFR